MSGRETRPMVGFHPAIPQKWPVSGYSRSIAADIQRGNRPPQEIAAAPPLSPPAFAQVIRIMGTTIDEVSVS